MRLGLIAGAWLVGVLAGYSLGLEPLVALLMAGAAVLAAVGLRLARMPAMPVLLVAFLLLGSARVGISEFDGADEAILGQHLIAAGSIVDDPQTRSRFVRFEMHVSQVLVNEDLRNVDERWLVYASPPSELVAERNPPYFRYGDRLVLEGTPLQPEPIEDFDYPAFLAAQGVSAIMFTREVEFTGAGGAHWRRAVFAVRNRLAESLERSMHYPESALASAVLLGKRESLPPDMVEQFRDTGASHMLAISGLHVGVLLAVSLGTGAWVLGRQRPTYLLVAAVAIWGYALVAGASPSALRAATMGTVYLAALGLGRPASALPALALAAALMTAFSPGLIRLISFQLSFAAVGGIALTLALTGGSLYWGFGARIGWLRAISGWLVSLSVISLAATLATWPLVAANFGEVALVSIPVSLLAIPAMAPLIVLAGITAFVGMTVPFFGASLGWIAVAPAAWVIGVVSAFPQWTVEFDGLQRSVLFAWYGILGIGLLLAQPRLTLPLRRSVQAAMTKLGSRFPRIRRRSSRVPDGGIPMPTLLQNRLAVGAIAAVVLAGIVLLLRLPGGADGNLHVHFLDIGQGDSTLIVTPSGSRMLIDGGPDGDVTSHALSKALDGSVRSLDVVVLTHLDSDHSQGLLEVLDRYAVDTVLVGADAPEGALSAEWKRGLERHSIVPVEVSQGFSVQLDDTVQLAVLNPAAVGSFGEANNDSVAMMLTHGAIRVLLAGDMESEAESRLVNDGVPLSSTVLKVGHHGSATSTTQRFVDAVAPSVAVISAGLDNPYGHPALEVTKRLQAASGAGNVYRTDIHGTVELVSDGAAVWVYTEN